MCRPRSIKYEDVRLGGTAVLQKRINELLDEGWVTVQMIEHGLIVTLLLHKY